MKSTAACIVLTLIVIGGANAGSISNFGILDGVIKNLLEGLRPNLTALVLPDIDASVNDTGVLFNVTTANLTTSELDTFEIIDLKTTLLPLRLDILQLDWAEVRLEGLYGLYGELNIDALKGPVTIDGEGEAALALRNITLRVENLTFNSKGGKLSVKDIELMTASLGESVVQLDNIFEEEDPEMTEVINVFLGFFLTEFVRDFGNDLLIELKPTIIEKLDEILADIDFP